MHDHEMEVKFLVRDLPALSKIAVDAGAHLVQPRTYEINLRFDTPEGDLARSFQVLRLRKDQKSLLTFKGPAMEKAGVKIRQEIEFEVGDFEAARSLLESLGYQVRMMYEKFRAVYDLGPVHLTLDELPYGNFAEIEGPDPESIQAVNQQLGLDWSARLADSYTTLFERLRMQLGLQFRDLSFANFDQVSVDFSILEIKFADIPFPR